MIENIRRYTGLIIVVIVVLLLGFIFMDTSGFFRRSAAGGAYVTVDGTTYTYGEYEKLGPATFSLAQQNRIFELFGFFNMLRGDALNLGNQELQFFAGRMVIRGARDEFGVHPSDEEVAEFIQGIRSFQTPPPPGAPPGTPGEFDQASYNSFVQRSLGSYSLVERDFQELIRDVIAAEKLRELIGGGLPGSRHQATAMTVVRAQQIEAGVASIDKEAFRESIKPTDDELKAYWETRKEAFKTEPRIKISYVLATPEYPEELEEKPDAPDAKEKTPDEQAAEDKAEQERDDARAKINKDLAIAVDDFLFEVEKTEGATFESGIGERGWKLVQTDWLTPSTLPADLQLPTRANASNRTVSDDLFGLTTGPDPLAPFTDAIAVGDHQYVMARLEDLEEVREKTFEEAKEEVLEQYVTEKANEAIETEVEEKTEAIRTAMADGKGFEEGAKEAGLEPRMLGPWAVTDTLDNEFHARDIFQLASSTNPGEFAKPFHQEDRSVIIYVKNREIVKDDNRGQQIDSQADSLEYQNESTVFAAWLNQAIQQANVQLAKGP